MVWRHAVKVALAAGEALAKGFSRAVREELRASQQAASSHSARQSTSEASENLAANARLGIALDESIQILNVKQPLDSKDVQEKYDHLFAINDKTKGGSFYLQSKIYRAKERIDEELRRKSEAPSQKENESTDKSSTKE